MVRTQANFKVYSNYFGYKMKTAKGKQIESLMNNSLFCCEIPASKGMFRSIKVDANAPFSGVVVMVKKKS
ncbi:MAG: hypothetical protein B7C24_16835 [Bacteroidetes bacterium 4572_77]|nr:MAG: hypothetical protein B7C24_16835 [Bacteroidetes bacterium 4572_77]